MSHSHACRGRLAAAALTLCCLAALTIAGRAQDEAPMPAQEAEAAPAATAPAAVTASGCLARTDEGVFQLNAASAVYTLTAANEDVNLEAQVGHAITVSAAPAATGEETAPKALIVSSLKTDADSCAAPPEAPAEAPAPGEAPPASPE